MTPDPGYLALKDEGYRFDNCGRRLGDRPGDSRSTCFAIYAPGGALLNYRRGIVAAYHLALSHYRHYQQESAPSK